MIVGISITELILNIELCTTAQVSEMPTKRSNYRLLTGLLPFTESRSDKLRLVNFAVKLSLISL